MKVITVELSNDQTEYLEQVSQLCRKKPSDFIREALICLLPLNEYIELKRNIVELQNEEETEDNNDMIEDLQKQMIHIQTSANNRLKRIGII